MSRFALLLTLVALGAGSARAGDPPPPSGPAHAAPTEVRIAETEVVTIGTFRVALAKTWEESRDGRSLRVAWISVVEKGTRTGPRDLELVEGDPLALGERSLVVAEVVLEAGGTPGHVVLRPR